MITIHLRYEIDPDQIEAFEEYARRWTRSVNRSVNRTVGEHHGCSLPSEGDSDVSCALFSSSNLAARENHQDDLVACAGAGSSPGAGATVRRCRGGEPPSTSSPRPAGTSGLDHAAGVHPQLNRSGVLLPHDRVFWHGRNTCTDAASMRQTPVGDAVRPLVGLLRGERFDEGAPHRRLRPRAAPADPRSGRGRPADRSPS